MYIDHATMLEIDPAGEYCEGIVNYALNAKGVRLAYMVREVQKGVVKCSLRALTPYRVDEVALKFGGGGTYARGRMHAAYAAIGGGRSFADRARKGLCGGGRSWEMRSRRTADF